jgi:hypothetical protein
MVEGIIVYESLGDRLSSPTRRIALIGALLGILTCLAIGITIWRFSVAGERYDRTVTNAETIADTGEARTSLFDTLDAAQRYGSESNRGSAGPLIAARNQLQAGLAKIAASQLATPAEHAAITAAVANTARLDASIAALARLNNVRSRWTA